MTQPTATPSTPTASTAATPPAPTRPTTTQPTSMEGSKQPSGATQRVVVLADNETATGYRLAGAEVVEATPDDAQRKLEEMITSNRYGLVAVDTGLIADPATTTARIMRGRDLPILLPIPSLQDAFSAEQVDAKAYMGKLVRETIGFDIKL